MKFQKKNKRQNLPTYSSKEKQINFCLMKEFMIKYINARLNSSGAGRGNNVALLQDSIECKYIKMMIMI